MKRNMLRQGAAIVMAVLLAMPALPVRAEARKGMAAAAGAEAGYAVEAVSVMEGARNTAELAFAALADEIVGGINPETAVDGDDDAGTEEPVSGGDAGMYGMKSGVAGAAAATGTIGQPDANGDVLEWSYDDSTQTLTVTGSGVTQGGELSGAPFDGMGIKKIVFQDCKVAGSMAGFFRGLGVEEIDLSGADTGSVTDMQLMFYDCSSLTRLELGNFDTSSVEYMDYMFYGCSSLTGLELGNFDTSSVRDMQYMFSDCSSLTGLELGNFDTSSVETMRYMFSGCSSLTGLELGSFDTSSVTDMEGMFSGCSSLSTLYTPYNVRGYAALPRVSNAVWHLPDGTEVTKLPQNLSTSVLLILTPVITITTETLNMSDVIRVKYVPYSYTVQTDNTDPDNQVTFSVVEGRLAEGLQMYPATGEIYGIPIESGEFKIKVEAAYSNPKYPPSYAELTLTVLENTDENVGTASDSGYRIIQAVPDLNMGSLSGPGTQLLVSEGEYAEFQDAVYLDGRRLQSGTEYTSEAGSTRITIQNQTLANAGAGSHTLSMEFRTQDTGALRRAAQNLTISAGEDTGSGDNTGNGGNEGNGGNTDNGGNTEDNTNNGGNGGTTDNTENNSGTNNGSGSSGSSGGSDVGWEENGTGGRTEPTVIDYIVQPGDNLWKISAKFFGDGSHWRQIYTDNTNIIRNPNILRTGWRLKIYLTAGNGLTGAASTPGAASPFNGSSYVVQQGDNLWKIAGEIYGKTGRWRDIYEANRSVLANPERIYAKQVLMIPR